MLQVYYIIFYNQQEEREAVPEDLIKCTVCAALFCSKKAYEVHNNYHQSDDLYVTSEEQRLQTVTKVDQDFDIRRVEGVADKYVPKTNTSKRSAKNWTKVLYQLNFIYFFFILYVLIKFMNLIILLIKLFIIL